MAETLACMKADPTEIESASSADLKTVASSDRLTAGNWVILWAVWWEQTTADHSAASSAAPWDAWMVWLEDVSMVPSSVDQTVDQMAAETAALMGAPTVPLMAAKKGL